MRLSLVTLSLAQLFLHTRYACCEAVNYLAQVHLLGGVDQLSLCARDPVTCTSALNQAYMPASVSCHDDGPASTCHHDTGVH